MSVVNDSGGTGDGMSDNQLILLLIILLSLSILVSLILVLTRAVLRVRKNRIITKQLIQISKEYQLKNGITSDYPFNPSTKTVVVHQRSNAPPPGDRVAYVQSHPMTDSMRHSFDEESTVQSDEMVVVIENRPRRASRDIVV
jgi:hypothetical protein